MKEWILTAILYTAFICITIFIEMAFNPVPRAVCESSYIIITGVYIMSRLSKWMLK